MKLIWSDGFAAKLSSDLGHITWATFVGGSATDSATAITVDSNNVAWLTGATNSVDFPNSNGWTKCTDFIVGVDPSGASLTYSALYPANAVPTWDAESRHFV